MSTAKQPKNRLIEATAGIVLMLETLTPGERVKVLQAVNLILEASVNASGT